MKTTVAYFPTQNLLFLGCEDVFLYQDNLFDQFQDFIDKHKGKYIFSALGYDLKNHFFSLTSARKDYFQFPYVLAFVPQQVLKLEGDKIEFLYGGNEISEFGREIVSKIKHHVKPVFPSVQLKPIIDRETYIQNVVDIQKEIQYGNCYELNFCQQYFANDVDFVDSFRVFIELYLRTKSPFSVYLNFDKWEVLCLSPERYIQKIGNRLISQPIKGTIRRGENEREDALLQTQLRTDQKECSENVMIVDLVRNDLSKIATKGSVKVDELFGIYQFETLHHMISTISCELKQNTSFVDCLEATFPMGSMTGAPKKKVMELIEKFEAFKRGLYSGSMGYFTPEGDFDFNVVIRSLFYNNELKTLSCAVGSAITIKAIPQKEYDECGVKVGNLIRSFQS